MMGLLAIVVIVLVLGLAVIGVGLGRTGSASKAKEERLEASPDALRYTVPDGHDPAVVIAALQRAGYAVAQDSHSHSLSGGTTVLIDSERGRPDREQVRHVLEGVDTLNLEGDAASDPGRPRFADE